MSCLHVSEDQSNFKKLLTQHIISFIEPNYENLYGINTTIIYDSQQKFVVRKPLNAFCHDIASLYSQYDHALYSTILNTDRLIPIIMNDSTAFIHVHTTISKVANDRVYGFANALEISYLSYNENDHIIIHFTNGSSLNTCHTEVTILNKINNYKKIYREFIKNKKNSIINSKKILSDEIINLTIESLDNYTNNFLNKDFKVNRKN